MELTFTNSAIDCLRSVLWEPQTAEQTQELRLSDGMPDIGAVVGAWGQVVLRSKEWNRDSVGFAAGMLVWVLYAPEDGSAERTVSSWIPFSFRWDLPSDTPEGSIRIQCLNRGVDARAVSPRKMLIRAGMSTAAEILSPTSVSFRQGEGADGDLQLLNSRYPVNLMKEAGEKAFLLDEALSLPESAPAWKSLVSCCLEPQLLECRVLTDKLVFRGSGKLKLLYISDAGQIHSWEFDIPFSQYTDLRGSYGSEAQGSLLFGVTSLEPDLEESGQLRLKCGVVGQYLITDREMVDVVEDAYSLKNQLSMTREEAQLPVLLETRRETLTGEAMLNVDADVVTDARFLPDFPRCRRTEENVTLICPGSIQILYYGSDGKPHTASARWEQEKTMNADRGVAILSTPGYPEVQAMAGNGSVTAKAELPLETAAAACQTISMITAVETAGERHRDPDRPSLILMRAGDQRLWDIARDCGSTMDAIRATTGFQGDPRPEQMLLIPVS